MKGFFRPHYCKVILEWSIYTFLCMLRRGLIFTSQEITTILLLGSNLGKWMWCFDRHVKFVFLYRRWTDCWQADYCLLDTDSSSSPVKMFIVRICVHCLSSTQQYENINIKPFEPVSRTIALFTRSSFATKSNTAQQNPIQCINGLHRIIFWQSITSLTNEIYARAVNSQISAIKRRPQHLLSLVKDYSWSANRRRNDHQKEIMSKRYGR